MSNLTGVSYLYQRPGNGLLLIAAVLVPATLNQLDRRSKRVRAADRLATESLPAGYIGCGGRRRVRGGGANRRHELHRTLLKDSGNFPAFRPLTDVRLSWQNMLGTGGVRELLWLEREEGYIANFLGVNAARHSSGKRLAEVADIVIDNCCVPEDAVVDLGDWGPPVAATSTLAVVAITMALTASLAAALQARGVRLPTFVSPNDKRFPADHNGSVFAEYRRRTTR